MATRPETTKTAADAPSGRGEAGEIKRKLAMRMGVAGVMIVALLGGLALFDYMGRHNSAEAPAPHFSEPVPVAKKAPVVAVESVREEKKAAETQASPDKPIPSLEAPPRPEVAAQPALPAASAVSPAAAGTVPASRPAAAVTSTAPAAQSTQGQVKAAAPVARVAEARRPTAMPEPEGSASPPVPAASLASEPAARVAAPTSPGAPPPPAPPRLFSGYGVQAGVFADARRAEELHARLVNAGIPATIESRVQVGPFKTREQAEAARAKLKEMGIDGVLLPPRGAKR